MQSKILVNLAQSHIPSHPGNREGVARPVMLKRCQRYLSGRVLTVELTVQDVHRVCEDVALFLLPVDFDHILLPWEADRITRKIVFYVIQ